MMENTCSIAENIKQVQDQIVETCIKYGRKPEDVILMCVSKTQPIEKLQQAYDAGITLFGENRVQELVQKADFFNENNVPCHIIGQLQTNKVKYLPELTNTIQSVDSIKLAKEIEKQYGKAGKKADVCLEINIGMEKSKGGVPYEQAIDIIYQLSEFKNIQVKGLMCVPPADSTENVRQYFDKMHKLFVDISDKNIDNISMSILSMGMSGDYPWAIAEGSTLVRIGTGIFGERNYNKVK